MLKRILLVLVVVVSSFSWAIPAGATECWPGKCTGACHLNSDASINVDPRTGTVTVDPPIECYA